MFSDKYKQENEQIKLDPEFLKKLSSTCIEELHNSTSKPENEPAPIHKKYAFLRYAVPIAAACLLLVVISQSNIDLGSKKDCNNFERSESYDMADTTTASSNEETAIEEQKEDSNTINSNSLTKGEVKSSVLDSTKEHANIIDLYEIKDWIPSDSNTLASEKNEYLSSHIDDCASDTTLDYADSKRIMFHVGTNILVYDRTASNIVRIASFDSLVSSDSISINVYKDGNYIAINNSDPNAMVDETTNTFALIYDVQTDVFLSLTKDEWDSLDRPSYATMVESIQSSFDSLKGSGTFISKQAKVSDHELLTLYYAIKDNLSSLVIAKRTETDVNQTSFETEDVFHQ